MKNLIVVMFVFLCGCAAQTQLVPIPEMPRQPDILMKEPQQLKTIRPQQIIVEKKIVQK